MVGATRWKGMVGSHEMLVIVDDGLVSVGCVGVQILNRGISNNISNMVCISQFIKIQLQESQNSYT